MKKLFILLISSAFLSADGIVESGSFYSESLDEERNYTIYLPNEYYDDLESYFYLFSIWNDKNECLSWDETLEWANILDLATPKVFYRGVYDEKVLKEVKNTGYLRCLLNIRGNNFTDSDQFSLKRKSISTPFDFDNILG